MSPVLFVVAQGITPKPEKEKQNTPKKKENKKTQTAVKVSTAQKALERIIFG